MMIDNESAGFIPIPLKSCSPFHWELVMANSLRDSSWLIPEHSGEPQSSNSHSIYVDVLSSFLFVAGTQVVLKDLGGQALSNYG